jgi:hypothetical protein
MKNGQKWRKVEKKTTFFEIKIDLQLRFIFKNGLTILRNGAYYTHNFIWNFLLA